jgi:hypothetical protein
LTQTLFPNRALAQSSKYLTLDNSGSGNGWSDEAKVPDPATNLSSPKASTAEPSAVQKWLSASAQRIGAQSAALVVKQGERKRLLAQVPRDQRPHKDISKIVDRALQKKQVIVRLPSTNTNQTENIELYAGFSIQIGGRPAAIIFRLQVPAATDDAQLLKSIARQALRRAEDPAGDVQQKPQTASLAPSRPDPQQGTQPHLATAAPDKTVAQLLSEQSALIDSVAQVLDQSNLAQALHALANGVAMQLGCQRVCIGLSNSRRLRVDAVSGLVDFDTQATLMIDIAHAMEEARDSGVTISIPVVTPNQIAPQSHASLAEQLKHPALLSVPLVDQERCVGVLFLERDRPFSDPERAQAERLAILVAPLLALKQMEAMGLARWIKRYSLRFLKTVFGRQHLGLKLVLSLTALLIIGSTLHTQMFRVNADAAIEASVRRAVVSSFPSFLIEVEKRAGDLVERGDVLARLDIEDLQLERIKWAGEQDKLAREYRANLAQRDRSKVQVLEARRAQAQAQIDLVDSQISRAVLRAPVDGVVVSGDLSQALGSPVDRGELLFEVASLENYRLVLHLDEADVGWINADSQGQLRLRSLTNQTFAFQVTAITPVSESGEGANTFRVEAVLSEVPDSLRPGMEGVAKIDVEPRSLAWIWTHSFVQWVRMQAWKFGGLG